MNIFVSLRRLPKETQLHTTARVYPVANSQALGGCRGGLKHLRDLPVMSGAPGEASVVPTARGYPSDTHRCHATESSLAAHNLGWRVEVPLHISMEVEKQPFLVCFHLFLLTIFLLLFHNEHE